MYTSLFDQPYIKPYNRTALDTSMFCYTCKTPGNYTCAGIPDSNRIVHWSTLFIL